MSQGVRENLADLAQKMADLYKALVANATRFDGLREHTRESIAAFQRLLERQDDKINRLERERIKSESEMTARISALEARLEALSEQALHAAAQEAARTIMAERIEVPAKIAHKKKGKKNK
ncbi:MAG: hypothetical protein HQL52_07030 [Magnetococcales bacterium]|nr:hypothetical protein [Magnetococcales bacterium]